MSFLVALCVKMLKIRGWLMIRFSVRLKVLLTILTSDDLQACVRGVVAKSHTSKNVRVDIIAYYHRVSRYRTVLYVHIKLGMM